MTYPIGFMQGRLSPLVEGKIQAFPWKHWREEFPAADNLNIHLMEWTLDQERLYENPLLTTEGQHNIVGLCASHGISVPSLTGDCFMQAPFWKTEGAVRQGLERDFIAIARSCQAVGIQYIVVPLVDNGRLDTPDQERQLVDFMLSQAEFLAGLSIRVVFECDFAPPELARFIGQLPADGFGVNYDTGNSAALDFDPAEEFAAYGHRIVNVHIKDRVRGGTTVPLGTGNAKFPLVFDLLKKQGYAGNYIMQTARAPDGGHPEALARYRDMIDGWIGAAI